MADMTSKQALGGEGDVAPRAGKGCMGTGRGRVHGPRTGKGTRGAGKGCMGLLCDRFKLMRCSNA